MRNGLAMLVLIVFIAVNPFSFGETQERSELQVLLELFRGNHIELAEWKLYTRGEIERFNSVELFEEGANNVMSSMERFVWEKAESNVENEHLYVTGTYSHPTLPLTERLSVYSYPSSKNSNLMYISYEISAEPMSKDQIDLERIQQDWDATLTTLFKEKPQIFTMVKGRELGSTDLDERAEELLQQLSAQKVEQLTETNFVSISAYNEKWNSNLMSKDQMMNLQLGLRQEPILGGKTTVTIGTPIITIEY